MIILLCLFLYILWLILTPILYRIFSGGNYWDKEEDRVNNSFEFFCLIISPIWFSVYLIFVSVVCIAKWQTNVGEKIAKSWEKTADTFENTLL